MKNLTGNDVTFQLKIAKDRKKGEKIVTDSQEKAYWRVYRPPPGFNPIELFFFVTDSPGKDKLECLSLQAFIV
jgi:hypothetical protein